MKKCINCGKKLHTGTKYCCQKCQVDFQYKQYISRWKQGKETGIRGKYQLSEHIRRYLFDKNNYSCEICGWNEKNPYTNKIPLEIHHIDGDYRNNDEGNLQLLCPNCHALTQNFKSRGKGRLDRKH